MERESELKILFDANKLELKPGQRVRISEKARNIIRPEPNDVNLRGVISRVERGLVYYIREGSNIESEILPNFLVIEEEKK